MNYVGIDIHKRYSVCAAQDERGRKLGEARIEGNSADGFVQYLKGLGGKSRVVIEACWNWGKLYDILEAIPAVEEVVLANPLKTRLIADAQIKTDKLDARALALLLRGGFIARAHVPRPETRRRKNLLRQRLYWSRLRTRLRNRVHALVDRHDAPLPQCSDLFGRKGTHALEALELPAPDDLLLREHLAMLELMRAQMRDLEDSIAAGNQADPMTKRLLSLPGVGPVLAAVIAAEIDTIERFPDASRLCAYAGLAPTTHASGGAVYHGRLLPFCDKWLRWAFVEAAWVAIGCSPYFGALYRRHHARGKPANTAIIIVARRMCRIAWTLLKEDRDFLPKAPLPPRDPSQGLPVKPTRQTIKRKPHSRNNFPGRSQQGLAAL
jgi:transposase